MTNDQIIRVLKSLEELNKSVLEAIISELNEKTQE